MKSLLSAVVAMTAVGVCANSISWEIENVTVENPASAEYATTFDPSNWAVAFISDYAVAEGGSGTKIATGTVADTVSGWLEKDEDNTVYGEGEATVADGVTTATYLVTIYDTTADTKTYYAVQTSDNAYLTVSYDSASVGTNFRDPTTYGTFTATMDDASGYKVVVPEPATAGLALVGIACLLRRRRRA